MTFLRFLSANAAWVGAGFLLMFLSSFGQTFFISIFSGEIRATFGLNHAQWGSVYAIGTFSSAVVMLWSGGLSDQFRTRSLGVFVLLGLVLACLGMAFNSWVVAVPIVIFVLRLTGQGMATHLAAVAMSRWFVAQRGRALAISNLGYSVGEAILPMIFVLALSFVAWQKLWIVAAAIVALSIPFFVVLLKSERSPQSDAEQNVSLGMNGRHWTRWEMLKHPLFWFVLPTIIGPGAFVTAFFFQQVPFTQSIEMDHIGFVGMLPIYTVVTVGANLLSGWALDQYGVKRIMPFYMTPMALAFVVFSQTNGYFGLGLGLALLGISSGANSTLPTAFWAEFYGTRHLGGIKSVATAVMVLGSALGPVITGTLLTYDVNLQSQFIVIAVYYAITVLLLFIGLRRYS